MNNKKMLIWLVGLVILFGFILTCPNKEEHKTAIVSKVTEIIKNDSIVPVNQINLLDNGILSKTIETATNNMLSINNYFIFSLGNIQYNNEKRVISIGILHHVFCLFDKKALQNFNPDGNTHDIE